MNILGIHITTTARQEEALLDASLKGYEAAKKVYMKQVGELAADNAELYYTNASLHAAFGEMEQRIAELEGSDEPHTNHPR